MDGSVLREDEVDGSVLCDVRGGVEEVACATETIRDIVSVFISEILSHMLSRCYSVS